MIDLSILIPARNEMFLKNTIDDLLAHCKSDFEIIAVLDGAWADPPVPDHPRVTLIHHSQSIGQRAATNEAARMARGKYVAKVDSHCAFDDGFDVALLADMQDDVTMVPVMRNLHIFDWVCPNGHRRYQGPSGPCKECGEPTVRDVVWIAKNSPQSTAYRFDPDLHFQYFNEFKKRPEGRGELTESLSLQGSFFLMTREKYFELNICDETWGSWGNQGTEVACKTWLSGGRVICNHKTWYAHLFRTQGGDFGFPYPQNGREVERARNCSRELFLNNMWEKQVRPLSWLVEKFWPVAGWTDTDLAQIKMRDGNVKIQSVSMVAEMGRLSSDHNQELGTVLADAVCVGRDRGMELVSVDKVQHPMESRMGLSSWPVLPVKGHHPKGILYYTDNRLDPAILTAVQKQILKNTNGHQLVSVSLKPIDFGQNIYLPLERGYLTMFKQILAGLEVMDCDIVFMAEHDVMYAPGYWDFIPPEPAKVYYNTNIWHVRASDGHALYYTAKRLSQLCAYREVLVEHYRKRLANTQAVWDRCGGDTREFRNFIRHQGFEPGTHHRTERVDDLQSEVWIAERPNLDIRHDQNLTPSRWRQDQFRDQRNCRDWKEAESVPGWYEAGKFKEMIYGTY